MLRRLGSLTALSLVPTLLVGISQAGSASPAPPSPSSRTFAYKVFEMCSTPGQQECVVSATRNGVPVTTDYPSTPGTHEWFYVDNGWRDGITGFNLNTITVPESGAPTASYEVDPTATWVLAVNTGPRRPRELNARVRNIDYTVGGNATSGFWYRLRFQPAAVAWRWADGTYGCDMTACGDSTTVAEFVSEGWANGYTTDLADLAGTGLPRGYVADRTGYVMSSNAQYQEEPEFDPALNALFVDLANPHLKAPGTPATGFFETFIPNNFLRGQMGVPYPGALTGGMFTVHRLGATTSTPFTLTHEPDGIWIRVHDIGFSRPTYRLKARPTAPGRPRWGSVLRPTATKVKLRFARPLADGGPNITAYQGRCRRGTAPWKYAKAASSPIYIARLTRRTVDCQVRAQNRIGWGRWSAIKRG
jgi:hypothetical protein